MKVERLSVDDYHEYLRLDRVAKEAAANALKTLGAKRDWIANATTRYFGTQRSIADAFGRVAEPSSDGKFLIL